MPEREALFYIQDREDVLCTLCSQQCRIAPNRKGKCGVRQNKAGKLYSLVYGELVAEHIDPIEKKPLFHILPGSKSLSISTMGCNFRCHHCQNSSISQVAGFTGDELRGRQVNPQDVIDSALSGNCKSISYTYVEPTIYYEFAYDCAILASQKGVKNVFVSNGYMSEGATRKVAPFLDAINIDVKSFSDDFYKKICGAKLGPVLANVELMRELGVWVEVTTLLIPGLNDDDISLTQIASFIKSVDPGIPWHVTAFHPMYRMMDRSPTPQSTLIKARNIGVDVGLEFVYQGNVPGAGGENTICPGCNRVIIERFGFTVRKNDLLSGRCPHCNYHMPGIWA